eukprot:5370219-Lingulodinium_polyedra.AAC.1
MPWVVIADPAHWEVVPDEVVSPLRQFVGVGNSLNGPGGVCFKQIVSSLPLLQHAATRAFWDMGRLELGKLRAYVAAAPVQPSSIFGLVQSCIQQVFPKATQGQ